MKKLQMTTLMAAIALFAFMAASCEKENVEMTGPDSLKSSYSAGDTVFIDDPGLATDLFSNNGEPEQSIYAFTKYDYDHGGKLIKMNYFKNPVTDNVSNTDRPFMVDEFIYENNRLGVMLRQYYNMEGLDVVTTIRKTLTYDRSGRLVEIITEKTNGQSVSRKHEVLAYDEIGNMVKKVVMGEGISYFYEYDKSRRLIRMTEYNKPGNIHFVCHFTYDNRDNILYKKFYFPVVSNDGENIVKRYIVKFDYDDHPSPYKKMRLPYLTLHEETDLLSNNNYTRIATPDKEVLFKYEYNLEKFPAVRYTIR
ncbi:MAG: hypothetical protein R6W78_16885 [Bacteroidales bacterium]